MEKCSLNQITALSEAIEKNEWFNENFDTTHAWLLLKDISIPQKKTITYLLTNHFYRRSTAGGHNLYKFLESLKFPIKTIL